MAYRRRQTEVFSLSFLDCMCCGFGAVILLFMIINSQIKDQNNLKQTQPENKLHQLNVDLLESRKRLVLAKNTFEDFQQENAIIEEEMDQMILLLMQLQKELEEGNLDTLAKNKSIEKLKSDIEKLNEERERMLAVALRAQSGDQIRSFTGEGDRQYLTGLKVGGERILILVDVSASMLDRKIINILRRRNMSDELKLRSVKWRQAVSSVDWLGAQFPKESKFQIYTFNNKTQSVIEGSDGDWIDVGDGVELDDAIKALRRTIPQNGTNLKDAFTIINELNPRPDNVILLIDSLPTMNKLETDRGMITGQERLNLYYEAETEIPSGIPINILLYPMEGDYNAAIAYWLLAYRTGGSFMSISKDWP